VRANLLGAIPRIVLGASLAAGNHETAPNPEERRGALPGVLWIALVAGTVDISENLIFNIFRNVTP
jgi:hypothetical protein